jgi:hypothetical protein
MEPFCSGWIRTEQKLRTNIAPLVSAIEGDANFPP